MASSRIPALGNSAPFRICRNYGRSCDVRPSDQCHYALAAQPPERDSPPNYLVLRVRCPSQIGEEVMNRVIVLLIVVSFFGLFCTTASAQQLPKSGSINFHTGWKYVADVMTPADKHMLGRGNAT